MTPPKATLESALAQAQSEIPAVKLDSMGHYNHKFASLGAVIETAKPILAKHGLSIVQFPTSVMGNEILTDRIGVRTVLLHSAGQAMEETITIPLPDGQNAAQEAGKIITYLRRYAYAAVLGMYAEEDNDANLPQTPAKPAQDKPSAKKQAPAKTGTSIPQALVDAKLADNIPHAAEILNKMPNECKADAQMAVDWGKKYRQLRDEGDDVDAATSGATTLMGMVSA